MSLTVKHHDTQTRDYLATFQITVRLNADSIAAALMDNQGLNSAGCEARHVRCSEQAIRDAVESMFYEGLEMAGLRIGDNHADDLQTEVAAHVASKHFPNGEAKYPG